MQTLLLREEKMEPASKEIGKKGGEGNNLVPEVKIH